MGDATNNLKGNGLDGRALAQGLEIFGAGPSPMCKGLSYHPHQRTAQQSVSGVGAALP